VSEDEAMLDVLRDIAASPRGDEIVTKNSFLKIRDAR
jgi:hypothetical protein